MNPFQWSFRAQFLAGFLGCAAILAYAIHTQLNLGLEPCPLCIFQRIAFAALGLVLLAGGLAAPKGAVGRRVWGGLAAVPAVIGAGIAARHVWIQLNPPPVPSCGAPLSFMRETMDTATLVRKVLTGTGDCGSIDWTFLGLSMPAWSLVWFVLLAGFALHAAFRKER